MHPEPHQARIVRCSWPKTDLDIAYHDAEWGVPVHDDHVLFEFLTLEGAQAGLSWSTILKKRENYRPAFAGFDPAAVARFTPARIERILADPGVVRHRGKIESTVSNAKAFLDVQVVRRISAAAPRARPSASASGRCTRGPDALPAP